MAYFRARCQDARLYFMDEPETALSPRTQLELVRLLRDAGEKGRIQFIIATHSPILLACPGAAIYTFDQPPIQRVEYRDTPTYQTYAEFMADPERAISQRED